MVAKYVYTEDHGSEKYLCQCRHTHDRAFPVAQCGDAYKPKNH